jgi:hypothetical protein
MPDDSDLKIPHHENLQSCDKQNKTYRLLVLPFTGQIKFPYGIGFVNLRK